MCASRTHLDVKPCVSTDLKTINNGIPCIIPLNVCGLLVRMGRQNIFLHDVNKFMLTVVIILWKQGNGKYNSNLVHDYVLCGY